MNKRHRYVPLEKITPGTSLADDLLDKLGHVLLPAGTLLTASILKAVAHHDIHQLSIADEDLQNHAQQEQEDEQNQARKLARLAQLFRHSPNEGPNEMLKNYLERYRRSRTS